ncbi:hypothetical protein Cocul_00153 [Corynebacterium oculi]|uniref:Uncharacterized protein n=1 Tax=Corynebacterium oculi TaxID=1544416 RepID=A0A0Q0UAZ9_9CORY|nr:hypothetical protein Cocul_00153 [Corynebacterium oculi]
MRQPQVVALVDSRDSPRGMRSRALRGLVFMILILGMRRTPRLVSCITPTVGKLSQMVLFLFIGVSLVIVRLLIVMVMVLPVSLRTGQSMRHGRHLLNCRKPIAEKKFSD